MASDLHASEQVDGLILGDDCTMGITGGTPLPHIEAPNAPVGWLYYRTNGEVWRKKTIGNTLSDWELASVGNQCCGVIPFCNADGSEDNVAMINGEIPFCNSDGTDDHIALV